MAICIVIAGCASKYTVQQQYNPSAPSELDPGYREYTLLHMPDLEIPKFLWDRGIEGYAIVMFDIDVNGATQNHEVVAAEMGEHFSKLAVAHTKKFTYAPRMFYGVPVTAQGVAVRVSYCLPERRNEAGFVYENKSENCSRLHP